MLRALLGELATVMLGSPHLVPERLMETALQFAYPQLEQRSLTCWVDLTKI